MSDDDRNDEDETREAYCDKCENVTKWRKYYRGDSALWPIVGGPGEGYWRCTDCGTEE